MGVQFNSPFSSSTTSFYRTFLSYLLLLLGTFLFPVSSSHANIIFGGGKRKVWTDKSDWDSGHAKVRISTTTRPGQIELDSSKSAKIFSTPYLYVPNSASNSLAQIDTRTGRKIWSISLQSVALDGDPSRTTVDVDGNVWVGLRRSNKVILVSKNGVVLKEIITGGVPRAITVDLEGNIWVGNWASNTVVKLDGASGKQLLTLNVPCAYGATTDIYGNIWVINRCRQQTLTKISSKGQILGVFPVQQGYGLATDSKGQVWVANYLKGCVYRFTNRGQNLGCIKLGQGCVNARGVAIDGQDNVWVVCSNKPLLFKLNNSGRVMGYTSRIGGHCVGLAVDANNFVWVISRTDNTATKVNTKTMRTVGTYSTYGLGPYTYSDMTGFQFQRVAKSTQGTWRAVHSAPCQSKWKKIHWIGRIPHGTSISVRARTAATRAGLVRAKWSAPLRSGSDPKLPHNFWIEVEVEMKTFDRNVSPSVTELTVEYAATGEEICNGMDDDCDGIVDNIPYTNQPLLKACSTRCGKGVNVCSGGQWRTCTAPQPMEEACNGRDDNCNGATDEGAKCKDGYLCFGGACTPTCNAGCPPGTQCKQTQGKSVCVANANCQDIAQECTKKSKICRNGRCVEPCAGVICKDGLICQRGVCRKKTCFDAAFACKEGQLCKADKCIPDPCKDSPCDANEACNNGKCVPSCARVECSLGKSCKRGKCEKDPCADIRCPPGGVCAYGRCYKNPCQTVSCPVGRVCIRGACKPDPCVGVKCPKQQICRPPHGDCYQQPYSRPPTTEYSIPPDGIPWSPPTFDGGFPPENLGSEKPDRGSNSIYIPPPGGGNEWPKSKPVGCNCAGNFANGAFPTLVLFLLLLFGYLFLSKSYG